LVARPTALERLIAKIDFVGPQVLDTPCWMWIGCIHKQTGYGRFHLDGRVVEAHRASYQLQVGQIPSGLELDHLCRTRACVRPGHLEPVPHHVNIARSPLIGLWMRAQQSRKNRCPQGHLYDVIDEKGHRRCTICRRAQKQRSATRTRRTGNGG
jgi:hypothetical protein